jgi:hypothetical protein
MITVQKHVKYFKQFQSLTVTEYIQNVDRAILNTVFGVSINFWRLAGDTLNITCNFLCCNYQLHRDFLITLYIVI